MFDLLRFALNTFAFLACVFALVKGGPAERWASLAVMANVVIGQTSGALAPSSDSVIRLVNDGLTALVLLGITIRYGALWMGGVMLFYAVQFGMHSFYLVMHRPSDYWHALINNLDYSGITWCLIAGTAVAWYQRARRSRVAAGAAP